MIFAWQTINLSKDILKVRVKQMMSMWIFKPDANVCNVQWVALVK